jgi:GTP-binding protein HflX
VTERGKLEALLALYPHAVPISARSGRGIAELSKAVSDALSRNFHDVDIETDVGNGRMLAYLAAHGEVLSRQFHDDRVVVHCRLPGEYLGPIERDPSLLIRPHHANGHAAIIETMTLGGPNGAPQSNAGY